MSTINKTSQLERARSLPLPSRQAMLNREPSVQAFWLSNQTLLDQAWQEWEEQLNDDIIIPDETLIDPQLRAAVNQAWQQPEKELEVEKLLQEVSPGVYEFQLFDPEKLVDLRRYLDEVANADIPLRPPYGIALNRGGAMLDERSEGYLAAPGFQAFYRLVLDKYMRPISRLIFPEIMGYDTQTFGFSIQYQPDTDTSLRLHTDASAVTMNINLNLPNEHFEGSEIDFYSTTSNEMVRYTFQSGKAAIHRGNVAHAARPITGGKRTNFVLWLYGDFGQVPSSAQLNAPVDARLRWVNPVVKADKVAPF